jgi:hypothetical protein
VTDPKIETIDDARQLAIQFLREEVAKMRDASPRVLVFGLWDGTDARARELLALPEGVHVDVALNVRQWLEILKSGRTYHLAWVVGADRLDALEMPVAPSLRTFFLGMPSLPGSTSFIMVSGMCLEPGARVVAFAQSSCRLLHAISWTHMTGQRFPQLGRELVILTRDDAPPKPLESEAPLV